MVAGISNDDATMMIVDRDVLRVVELEIARASRADARQERLVAQTPQLYSRVAAFSDEDAAMIVIDCKAPWIQELR